MAISGKYAFAGDFGDGILHIFDVSNPANPQSVGSYSILGEIAAVAVSGKYAYVAESFNGAIDVLDISNPASPSLMKSYVATGISPKALYISGKYLYVADGSKGFYSLDISNPANPVLVGSYNPGSVQYYGVAAAGDYAYVSDHAGNVIVLDVSASTTPRLVGTLSVGGTPWNLVLAGKYAYVADDTNGLKVIDINGAQLPAANIGSLATNDLNVSDNEQVGGDITAGGGLDVGISGIFSRGTIAAFVASSTQVNPVVADFMGGNVGIGTTSPYLPLSVAGSGVIGNTLTAGVLIATSSSSFASTTLTGNSLNYNAAFDNSRLVERVLHGPQRRHGLNYAWRPLDWQRHRFTHFGGRLRASLILG